MPYNVTASPNAPTTLGFPSGSYYDNSIIYPGTGNFGTYCGNQNPGIQWLVVTNRWLILIWTKDLLESWLLMVSKDQEPTTGRFQPYKMSLKYIYLLSCGGGELFDNIEAKFYLNHPKLAWVGTNGSAAASVQGAIKIVNPYGTFYVGRIGVTFPNGTFKQIGKIYNGFLFYTFNNSASYATTSGAVEVLACLP